MLVPNHYENLQILHENTMPERCYYIPASKAMDCLVEEREKSDRIQILNGNWKFRYYPSVYDVEDDFFTLDFDSKDFAEIPVPGVWQNYGYDRHQYTNFRYPFPVDPPYVPQENPCGAYLHHFTYEKDSRAPKVYIELEGVDSCFYLWLNGTYIGYSQVSHALSEFDITSVIREGENTLAVLVFKWCDGSYMEDQDKFRMTGIFRDVYLMKRPEEGILDYDIHTVIKKDGAEIQIQNTYRNQSIPVHAKLFDAEGHLLQEKCYEEKTVFQLEKAHLWNSEDPYLYRLELETEGEVITEEVGIREIHTENAVLYVNGKAIKFRGVNRHDSDPVTGSVISVDQMKKDLAMMKQHNFNAIRSSHYPNQPMFYQMCDRYGFYVIDEADNESHGTWMIQYEKDCHEERAARWNEMIADNPDFEEATLDRIQKLVIRDKNRPCVVIWSMGNECGYGSTIEKSLAWTKTYDPSRLTHYESAFYRGRKRKYDYSNLDLYSRMYPELEDIENYANANPDKPFILCEYSHSMGNGAGDYEDYFQLIDKYDCVCGAFVWEWCDHAIYKGKTEEGKKIYYYGGDHGEKLHDGNFCMDGLVYPDRRPHTGLLEYKNVHRPARIVSYDQETGVAVIKNYLNYMDLKEYAHISYEVTLDGEKIYSHVIDENAMPSVKAGQKAKLHMPIPLLQKGRAYLKVFWLLNRADAFRTKGYNLGFDEILLHNEDERNQTCVRWEEEYARKEETYQKLQVSETARHLIIYGKDFTYTYHKQRGSFSQICVQDKNYLDQPMAFNIWRAPTDNDMQIKQEWMKAMYHQATARVYSTEYLCGEKGVEIHSSLSMQGATVQRMMDMDLHYTIDHAGKIRISADIVRNMEFPELPRFGLRCFLPASMDEVIYYGLGPEESYIDKKRASYHGQFRQKVENLHEDYIKPQENGSHGECDYVIIEGKNRRIRVYSDAVFSFNASVYSQEELTEKQHNYELIPCGSTVLNIDYRQNAIGSNSCGPRPLKKYRLDEEKFHFGFNLLFE